MNEGHAEAILNVQFSPNGLQAASSSGLFSRAFFLFDFKFYLTLNFNFSLILNLIS